MEESKEELDAKINEYTNQLNQVKGFLLSDPNNNQFLKLKEDLEKVINLTVLINSQNDDITSSSSTGGGQKGQRNSSDYNDHDDDYNLEDNDSANGDDNDYSNGGEDRDRGGRMLGQPAVTGVIQVGECVEVLGGDRPYSGTVTGQSTLILFYI